MRGTIAVVWLWRFSAIVACAWSAGCGAQRVELFVDLVTDWRPRAEVATVRTELLDSTADGGGAGGPDTRSLGPVGTEDFLSGHRVAEFLGLQPGRRLVRVTLQDAAGAILGRRTVEVDLITSRVVTVVITRRCRRVVCPGVGDTPAQTECLDGRCVEPACRPDAPGRCAAPLCTTADDCTAGGCAVWRCERGACLCDLLSPCADDARECDVATVQGEDQACGSCGHGMQHRERICDPETCTWRPWSEWGTCGDAGECTAGAVDTQSQACGGCSRGTQSRQRTCDAGCAWGSWSGWSACAGGGACAPGTERAGCDPCGKEVCGSDCRWGGCVPAVGCLYMGGRNYRCCGPGLSEFCLMGSCNWSGVCDGSCTSCAC